MVTMTGGAVGTTSERRHVRSGVGAKLFCRTGALAGADHRLGDEATIGRGPGNTIVLTADVVSDTHARIAYDPAASAYFLEDLESTNGTRLDGVPVSGRRRLGDLHVVTLGEQHDFIFVAFPEVERQAGSPERADLPFPARSVEPATSYEPPPALDVPPLETVEADGEPEPPGEEPGAPVPEGVSGGGVGEEAASRPVEAPATRYEAAPELEVPPLAVEPEPPEKEPGPALPDRAGQRDGGEDAAVARPSDPATWHEPPRALDVPPLGAEAETPSGATVEIAIADGKPERVALGDGRHVLGRAKDCAIPVDDITLSRRHAAFVVRGGVVTVTDLNSLNGTFVDDEPVDSATEVDIGQTVTFGNRVRVVRVAP